MSDPRFEGLNLPGLFELMHDVVQPEPVSMMPATPGWWILLLWLGAVVALLGYRYVQHRRRNRYRRAAQRLLEGLDASDPTAAGQMAGIVKRTALAVYPRREVAALHGQRWAEFLMASARQDAEVVRTAPLIAQAPYTSTVRAEDIRRGAIRWVRLHRA